eukprot:jgi/Hompol1/4356/HPOL_001754-RA
MPRLRQARAKLEPYYQEVSTIIIARQNPATGLIPASTAVTTHGDYRDAWTRDNVYSILAVWGLALAYRRIDDEDGRAYELEHATIKCMRGLLFAMIRQADKVELFKNTQAPEHSLHAKYNTATGGTVVGDLEWGHLQIDATSLFLLMLAQMTSSGLHIIYTIDEVHFIQNLVFYIERAYRTPDYGVWERGNKINHGQPELNCSSIGMVVAALQAINGINLFGSRGGPLSVIHVLPDEITRNSTTLHSALPRESPSKEIDAALLAVISFPAFAVNSSLATRTRNEIIKKLGGRYGCKRFLRDGHQTVLEDSSRLHYDPHELKVFEGVESEWPLFFTYLILDGLFRGDKEQVEHYREMMQPLLIDSSTISEYNREFLEQSEEGRKVSLPQESMLLVPELYIVPLELINAERARHGSQDRVPNQNIPLVWAQSLLILGNLIYDDLLSVADIDPLNRRLLPFNSDQDLDTVVQLVFLSETAELQSKLRTYGLETQTVDNCSPITISPPSALMHAYQVLGENRKLKLSGRPKRPMGTLSTCKVYRCQGQLYAFLPHFMDREEFYLVSDNDYLVSLFEQEVAFVRSHWFSNGRPTMIVLLTEQMLGGVSSAIDTDNNQKLRLNMSNSKRNLLNFMMSMASSGLCNGVRVRVGRLSELIGTACIESLDFLVDTRNTDYEDWEGILRGRERPMPEQSVLLSNRGASTTEPSNSRKSNRCTLRMSSLGPESPRSRKSPLVSPVFGDDLDDREEFRLREHREDEPSKLELGVPADARGRSLSPARPSRMGRAPGAYQAPGSSSQADLSIKTDVQSKPDAGASADLLALTLGDASQMDAAIKLLCVSANLYDQIDILHYISSCNGLTFVVPGLSSVSNLIEEVYIKAMQMKQWSVVRHAAGLLKKTVNSLTSNLSDLLVRQKPVTIGFGDREFFIDSPRNPSALTDIIFEHCASDIREAPFIQEILTYLGSFIRGSPQIFDGIMRIRTHLFIIAMREEVSRLKNCDEEEAVEILMQLSPFETKSLMGQVLTVRDQVDVHSAQAKSFATTPRTSRLVHIDEEHGSLKDEAIAMPVNLPNVITLSAQSGGFQAGNFAKMQMTRDGHEHPIPGIFGRGLNVAFFDPIDGSVMEVLHFDTCASTAESDDFARRIETLESGVIAVVCVKDDAHSSLTESARAACEQLGSGLIRQVLYRDSWCLIGEKGATPGTAVEFHRQAHLGPTETISATFDLLARRSLLLSNTGQTNDQTRATPTSSIMPSNGRWLRRRKNDGALNRVPRDFYPKVWRLLSKTEGLGIGKAFLPREPITSETTPEELNFALQVEALFDNIRDPAERQIAVELLVVISRIEDRNPEIKLTGKPIPVLQIIRVAVAKFWHNWISEQGHGTASSTASARAFAGIEAETVIASSVVGQTQGTGPHESKHLPSLNASEIQQHAQRVSESTSKSDASSLVANLEQLDLSPHTQYAPGLSFEKNERLARRLFFDLPDDGPHGSMFFLASACVQSIFDVRWSPAAL